LSSLLGEVQAAFNGAGNATNEAMRAQIAYQNAVNDFQVNVGQAASPFFTGAKEALTGMLTKVTEVLAEYNELNAAAEYMNTLSRTAAASIAQEQLAIEGLKQSREGANSGEIAAIDEQIKKREELIQKITENDEKNRKNSEENITLLEKEYARLEEGMGKAESGFKQVAAGAIPIVGPIVSAGIGLKNLAKMKEWVEIKLKLKEQGISVDERKAAILEEIGAIKEELELHGDVNKELDERARLENERKSFAAEFEQKLQEQTALIIKQAELNGLDINGQEVKKQILDAQLSTYHQMLEAAGKLADGTYKFNDAVEATIQAQRKSYEASKTANDAWKKSIDDIISKQKKLNDELKKLYEGVVDDAKRQDEENKEREHQKKLAEIMKKSKKEALDYVAEYNEQKQKGELAERRKKIKDSAKEAFDENEKVGNKKGGWTGYWERRRDIEKTELESLEALENIHADKVKIIYEDLDTYLENLAKEQLEDRLAKLQEYLNAAQSIASNISAAWKNSIDYKLEEDLRANDKIEQSDEERAAKEEELQKKAAKERYKADMVAWAANVTLAYAQAAMAVLQALGGTPGPAQYAAAALAAVVGATQVAAVISAQPKPPRFHEGGIVQGRGEVPAVLKEGEVVSTQKQFSNIMKAFANVANVGNNTGTGGLSLNVNVENQVSNAQVEPSLDMEGLKIAIRETVNGMMANGELDRGFAGKELHDRGLAIT